MRRYEEPADAVPHEVNALVLAESDGCFGERFEAHFAAVRDRLSCDKLLLEEYYHDLSDLSDRELLIQHGVWVVHAECLVEGADYPELDHYLATGSIPDATVVVACVDPDGFEDPDGVARRLADRYHDGVVAVTDGPTFVGYLSGFLAAVNPCSPAGLEYILRWNNDVCDDIEVV